MSRPRKLSPSYLPHSATGRARLVWRDMNGLRQEKLLPGPIGSPESLAAKARLELELATSPTRTLAGPTGIFVADVLAAYLDFAATYYTDADGNPTKELGTLKAAVKPVRELYADLPAAEFGPQKLKAVRQKMIDAGLCRGLVNRRIDRVRRAFKWAVSEELVPVAVYESLRTLTGLRRGRSDAPEAEPVKPVADEVVKATLPHLPPHVRAMVELMWHTGMRPGEVCAMTLGQIDRAGTTWTYRPVEHKTRHRGKDRAIPLGPNARAVLVAFLRGRSLDPDEPLFSPARAREERFREMRANRKTPVQPSQLDRSQKTPGRKPGKWYVPTAVSHAIAVATKNAGIEHWFPYQLRHSYGTRVRKAHGLEAAQVLLGHARADVTQIYAEKNEELAASIAQKIG